MLFAKLMQMLLRHTDFQFEVKYLVKRLKRINPNIEKNIFNSVHAVCIETFPGYKAGGEQHSFLEDYETDAPGAKKNARKFIQLSDVFSL